MPPKSPASAPAAIASTSAAASAAARCRRGAIALSCRGAFLVTSPGHVTPGEHYAPPADYERASHRRRRRGGRYGARAVRARGARARPVAAAPPRGARGRGTPVAAPSTLRRVRCRRRRAGRSGVWLIAVRAGSAGTAGYGYYAANWRRSRIDYTQDGQVSVAENAPGRRLRLLPAPADVCAAPRARSAAAGRPPQTLRPAPRPSLHRQECARVRVRVRTQAGIHMGGGGLKRLRGLPARARARALYAGGAGCRCYRGARAVLECCSDLVLDGRRQVKGRRRHSAVSQSHSAVRTCMALCCTLPPTPSPPPSRHSAFMHRACMQAVHVLGVQLESRCIRQVSRPSALAQKRVRTMQVLCKKLAKIPPRSSCGHPNTKTRSTTKNGL